MDELLKILIPILIAIESGGDPNAVGDNEKAIGILQIHKICVDDVNRILDATDRGGWHYDYDDRLIPHYSKSMCKVYLTHYKPKWDGDYTELEKLCQLGRIWNGGPKGHTKPSTMKYRAKIIELYNKRE